MADQTKTFMIENAELIFRNFSGEEGQFNKAGDRNFCVVLDPKTAALMAKDGWNVKKTNPRDDEEPGIPYIQITVGFKYKPPRITMITSTAKTPLDQASVGVLDWADIQTCDLIARAYDWEVNGKTGIKAYLQTMFVTIEEDALERKYNLMDAE